MILLANVFVSTARSIYDTTTTGTSAPFPYLTSIRGHIEPIQSTQLTMLPQAAYDVLYSVMVPSGTDIIVGDIISSIMLPDKITPWPATSRSNVVWIVRHAQEEAPVILPSRMVYIASVTTGGYPA